MNMQNSGCTDIYIYGAGKRGRELLALIRKCYGGMISIKGFIDQSAVGKVENYNILRLSEVQDKSVRIVISVGDFGVSREINVDLHAAGFEDVWWYLGRHYRKEYENFFQEQCVSCREWGEDILLHVEMHAMDACNLNCVGCTHFSPIFKKNKPNTQDRLADVKKLREKITSIVRFDILGGEPFLNPDLCSYTEIKNIYPYAHLSIVTNGLLLLKTPEKVLKRLRDENVCISISEYKPTHQCMDEILRILNQYNLVYTVRGYEKKKKFNIPLMFEKGQKYCISNGCVNVWNGKIAKCPTLMYITEFNKYFNTNFPEEGIIPLTEDISGKELTELLEKDVPLCCYCGRHEVEWDICGRNVTIDKFVKMS